MKTFVRDCAVARFELLPDLRATLDSLVYHYGGQTLPPGAPHAFVYHITISNGSTEVVTLVGRKWQLVYPDGSQKIIEGDKIVGETPRLEPGESFTYSSYHATDRGAVAQGTFYGVTPEGRAIYVKLPTFELELP